MLEPCYRDSGCNGSRNHRSRYIIALVACVTTDHTKLLKLATYAHCQYTLPKAVTNLSFSAAIVLAVANVCHAECQSEWLSQLTLLGMPVPCHRTRSLGTRWRSMKLHASAVKWFCQSIHLWVWKRSPSGIIRSRLLLFLTNWARKCEECLMKL